MRTLGLVALVFGLSQAAYGKGFGSLGLFPSPHEKAAKFLTKQTYEPDYIERMIRKTIHMVPTIFEYQKNNEKWVAKSPFSVEILREMDITPYLAPQAKEMARNAKKKAPQLYAEELLRDFSRDEIMTLQTHMKDPLIARYRTASRDWGLRHFEENLTVVLKGQVPADLPRFPAAEESLLNACDTTSAQRSTASVTAKIGLGQIDTAAYVRWREYSAWQELRESFTLEEAARINAIVCTPLFQRFLYLDLHLEGE